MIHKLTVSRDDTIYEAWPDVTLTPSGKLVCVFSECTHHGDRSYTRIVLTDSTDRGRTWTPKRPLTEPTHGLPVFWNCARLTCLHDGRLVVVVDKLFSPEGSAAPEDCRNYLFFSEDEGATGPGYRSTACGTSSSWPPTTRGRAGRSGPRRSRCSFAAGESTARPILFLLGLAPWAWRRRPCPEGRGDNRHQRACDCPPAVPGSISARVDATACRRGRFGRADMRAAAAGKPGLVGPAVGRDGRCQPEKAGVPSVRGRVG